MNKVIFGVFAHPDDEAFGPSGALLKKVRQGAELHLIVLTSGDAGTNPDKVTDLGLTRIEEWRQAGKLLGAKSMHLLGYSDGTLNNQDMIKIGERIKEIAFSIGADHNSDTEIEFMSMDTNGITGHVDHIVASRSALWAFYKLKKADKRMARIYLACISEEDTPKHNTNWLYMDKGRSANEIDETVDAREFRDEIIQIIRTHKSQRHDGENHIQERGDKLGINHFIVKT